MLLCPSYAVPSIITVAPMKCAWLPSKPAHRTIATPCAHLRSTSTGWPTRRNAPSSRNRRRRPLAEATARRRPAGRLRGDCNKGLPAPLPTDSGRQRLRETRPSAPHENGRNVWYPTADPDAIIEKARREKQVLE